MLTKQVFSARLNQSAINKIKQLSQINSTSISNSLENIIEQSYKNIKVEDPWKNFIGSADLGDNFEDIIKDKRKKNFKLRQLKKDNG